MKSMRFQSTDGPRDDAADYDACVRREREASQALHAHPPGTADRAHALSVWMDAISKTNAAWRRYSATRATRRDGTDQPGRPHAGA